MLDADRGNAMTADSLRPVRKTVGRDRLLRDAGRFAIPRKCQTFISGVPFSSPHCGLGHEAHDPRIGSAFSVVS
jgi:hypothetical protein